MAWANRVECGMLILLGLGLGACVPKLPDPQVGLGAASVNSSTDSEGLFFGPGEAVPVFQAVGTPLVISGGGWGLVDASTPGLSADGQFVLFASTVRLTDDPWVPFASGGQYYRKDLKTGQSKALSRNMDGQIQSVSESYAHLSRNGRYGLFAGEPGFLSHEATSGYSGRMIYRKDFDTDTIEHVSTDGYPGIVDGRQVMNDQISADGRYIVFGSRGLIHRRDMTRPLSEVVSTSPDRQTNVKYRISASGMISISGDGDKVVFTVAGPTSQIVPGDSGGEDQLVLVNVRTNERQLVSCTASGVPFHNIARPRFSADSSKVFIQGSPLDSSLSSQQIYRKDLSTGSLDLVSSNSSGMALDSHSLLWSASDDGRYVCFSTWAQNHLIPGVGSGAKLAVKDLQSGKLVMVEYGANGEYLNLNGNRSECALSGDGRYVVFSAADGSGGMKLLLKQLIK